MAKKTAQVDIKITGSESIASLENELSQINQEISNIDVNSKAFQTLSNRASEVSGKLKNAKVQLEGVTGKKQAEAAFKLGETFAGAFATMQSASLLFGEKASEDFQKVIAKVGTLMLALDTIRKASEAFSAENLKGLSSIGRGFGNLVRSVKGASTAMKTALISTGIGALVVAVGLLITNFDKLKNLVSRKDKEEKKAAEGILQVREGLVAEAEQEYAAKQKYVEKIREEAKINEENYKKKHELAREEYELATKQGYLLDKQLEAEEQRLKIAEDELAKTKEKKEEKRKELQTEIDRLKLSITNIKGEREVLGVVKNRLSNEEYLSRILEKNASLHFLIKENITKANNQLTILNAQANKTEEIYKKQLEILDNEIKEAYLKIFESTEAQVDEAWKNYDALKAQRTALILQEKERKKQLAIELDAAKIAREYSLRMNDILVAIDKQNEKLAEGMIITTNRNALQEDYQRLFTTAIDSYKDFLSSQEESTNFEVKKFKSLQDQISRYGKLNDYSAVLAKNFEAQYKYVQLIPSQLFVTKEAYAEIEKIIARTADIENSRFKTTTDFGEFIQKQAEQQEINFRLLEGTYRISEKISNEKANELGLYIALKEAEKEVLKNKEDELKATQKIIDSQIEARGFQVDLIEGQKQILQNKLNEALSDLEKSKNDEERLMNLQKVIELENELRGLNDELASTQGEIANLTAEQNANATELKNTEADIAKISGDVAAKQQEVTAQLIEQSRLSSQLKDFTNQYAAEIDVVRQGIGAMFELWATQQDNIAKKNKRLWQDYQNNINKSQKKIDDLNKSQLDYEEELKDANGERYDELVALMGMTEEQRQAAVAAEQADIDANLRKQKEAEYAIAVAEYKAEKRRKAAAIVDAAIAAALAVIKALPNVFLATATGVLSAVQIAIVASQKVIEPKKEDFGLARGGLLVGALHKDGGIPVGNTGIEVEGGEFVVNRKATEQYLPVIEAINNQGRRKMAEGGTITPVSQAISNSNIIDYNQIKLAMVEAVKELTVVTELIPLANGLNNITKTKQSAGI